MKALLDGLLIAAAAIAGTVADRPCVPKPPPRPFTGSWQQRYMELQLRPDPSYPDDAERIRRLEREVEELRKDRRR